jgi:hypothetical protein
MILAMMLTMVMLVDASIHDISLSGQFVAIGPCGLFSSLKVSLKISSNAFFFCYIYSSIHIH